MYFYKTDENGHYMVGYAASELAARAIDRLLDPDSSSMSDLTQVRNDSIRDAIRKFLYENSELEKYGM